ncbi:MAG: nucleotidyltransferase family protein [Chthoniobacterales bacterium]
MSEINIAFGVVILGAGASRRMGTCKLLLPWGNGSILQHLLAQWKDVGITQIAPVVNPANLPLRHALQAVGFSSALWIENYEPDRGMFSSLQEAARWGGWEKSLTHWIVSLGDQPQIRNSTLHELLAFAKKNPTKICQPEFEGRGAHPIILPVIEFHALAQTHVSDFRTFIRERESLRLRMAVDDPGVLGDLDTPEDYERWKVQI